VCVCVVCEREGGRETRGAAAGASATHDDVPDISDLNTKLNHCIQVLN
jgi:hypothetical protein